MTWFYEIDVSDIMHNDDFTVVAKAHAIADRIRKSQWFIDYPFYLAGLLTQLEMIRDEWEFDHVWEMIYDMADDQRCWLNTTEDHQNEHTNVRPK